MSCFLIITREPKWHEESRLKAWWATQLDLATRITKPTSYCGQEKVQFQRLEETTLPQRRKNKILQKEHSRVQRFLGLRKQWLILLKRRLDVRITCKDTTQRWREEKTFMVRFFFLCFMLSLFKKFKQFLLTQIKEWFSLVNHLKLGVALSVGNYKGWSLSVIQSTGWLRPL